MKPRCRRVRQVLLCGNGEPPRYDGSAWVYQVARNAQTCGHRLHAHVLPYLKERYQESDPERSTDALYNVEQSIAVRNLGLGE
ncbi:MAG: hypothetical protein K6T68_01845 [Alicyclobacillus shizuokensis]|nr:hypothetical protein [Alicyclobacillus shizuokensis]